LKIFSAQRYVYFAIYVQKFTKLGGIIKTTLGYGCGNWSPIVANNINWSICEQGTEESFSTKIDRINRIWRSAVLYNILKILSW
jgi:hypothetical protein